VTQPGLTRPPHGISGVEQGEWTAGWDNTLHPDIRDLAARIVRIERHLGLAPDQLAAQFELDPPASWVDGEPQCPQTRLGTP
jgi:hypothetical protein